MAKKPFIIMSCLLVVAFAAVTVIKYYRPKAVGNVSIADIPLTKADWLGQVDSLQAAVLELLSPDQFFAASYANSAGVRVQLFVDYYSPDNKSGAIHSPRNCLPGSGWVILRSSSRKIGLATRQISARRFYLRLGESRQVMDFWYITRRGETANDYMLKLSTMASALTLRPTDKAFVRLVAMDDSESIAALEEFETIFIGEIYKRLPF